MTTTTLSVVPKGQQAADVGDALRMEILRWLDTYAAEHDGECPSAVQVAEHFDRAPANIRTHLRRLEDQGFVRLERRQVVKL